MFKKNVKKNRILFYKSSPRMGRIWMEEKRFKKKKKEISDE